jgi:hypothetical protein
MIPSDSPPYSQTARIPPQRFMIHLLLSALATTIPQLIRYLGGAQLEDIVTILSWSLTNTCGHITHHVLAMRHPHDRDSLADDMYSCATTALVAALHVVTILLGRYVHDAENGFTTLQHMAVHFCLVFYVISELEFYRAYAKFARFATYKECFKRLHRAHTDPGFVYCRDPFGYVVDVPDSWRGYLDGESGLRTGWAVGFTKSHGVFHASCLVFHVVCGLVNYLIKLMVNPELDHNLCSAMLNWHVLFGTYPRLVRGAFLGLALLRVVRQANYVGFWVVAGLLKRRRGKWGIIDVESENKIASGLENLCKV